MPLHETTAANTPLMLYAAVARAAKALGYKRVVTYAPESGPGTTLRASGWRPVATTGDRPWHNNRKWYGVDQVGRARTHPQDAKPAGSAASRRDPYRSRGQLSPSPPTPRTQES